MLHIISTFKIHSIVDGSDVEGLPACPDWTQEILTRSEMIVAVINSPVYKQRPPSPHEKLAADERRAEIIEIITGYHEKYNNWPRYNNIKLKMTLKRRSRLTQLLGEMIDDGTLKIDGKRGRGFRPRYALS